MNRNDLSSAASDVPSFFQLAQAVSVPVGWRLGGQLVKTLVATINDITIFWHKRLAVQRLVFFLRRLLFSWKECSDQETCLAKIDGSIQKPMVGHLSTPRWTFSDPLVAILNF